MIPNNSERVKKRKRIKEALKFATLWDVIVPAKIYSKGLINTEKFIFNKKRKKIITLIENCTSNVHVSYNNPLYELPNFKNIKTALHRIDQLRENAVRGLDGKHSDLYILNLKKNLNNVAHKYIVYYEEIFARENARILKLKKTNQMIVANEEEFKIAQSNFNNLKILLKEYAKSSEVFIEKTSLSKKDEVTKFIKLYKYQNNRIIKYFSIFENLTKDAIKTAQTDFINAKKIYKDAITGSFKITRDLIKPAPIPLNIRRVMTAKTLQECQKTATYFKKNASKFAKLIQKNYNDYNTKYYRTRIKIQKDKKIFETKIAQREIDILFDYSKLCATLRNKMNYTQKTLIKYQETYNLIKNQISNNVLKNEVVHTLKKGSLIPLINEFNTAKIQSEILSRDILTKEGMKSLSGAISLYRYYIKKGIKTKKNYSTKNIKEIKKTLTEKLTANIGPYKANGKKLNIIDMKTTAELNKMLNLHAWNDSTENQGNNIIITSNKTKLQISLIIPTGWRKTEKKNSSLPSIYRSFFTPDKSGEINITAIKNDEKNLRIFSKKWLSNSNFKMVKKKWGMKQDQEYLWILSSNNTDEIMQSYMLKENGYVIILSGKCMKNKYNFMKKKINKIFTSMNI